MVNWKAIIKLSSVFWKYFPFILQVHFNRLYHTGKCFNLLNTWKVYFWLVMCLRAFIPDVTPNTVMFLLMGKSCLQVCCWERAGLQSGVLITHQWKPVSALGDFQPQFLVCRMFKSIISEGFLSELQVDISVKCSLDSVPDFIPYSVWGIKWKCIEIFKGVVRKTEHPCLLVLRKDIWTVCVDLSLNMFLYMNNSIHLGQQCCMEI